MNMQGQAGQTYKTRGGTYVANSTGVVSNVANGDVTDMVNSGCVPIDSTFNASALNLLNAKNVDGSALAAAAAAGKFGITETLGSAFNLIGEVATSNTKTDAFLVAFQLPQDYTAGTDLTVTINGAYVGGAATVHSVDLSAYRLDQAGGQGADICATAIQDLAASAGANPFTVTGATLSPGDIIQLKVTTVITEAAAGAVHSAINSVTVG